MTEKEITKQAQKIGLVECDETDIPSEGQFYYDHERGRIVQHHGYWKPSNGLRKVFRVDPESSVPRCPTCGGLESQGLYNAYYSKGTICPDDFHSFGHPTPEFALDASTISKATDAAYLVHRRYYVDNDHRELSELDGSWGEAADRRKQIKDSRRAGIEDGAKFIAAEIINRIAESLTPENWNENWTPDPNAGGIDPPKWDELDEISQQTYIDLTRLKLYEALNSKPDQS